jgi:hypothetical protein
MMFRSVSSNPNKLKLTLKLKVVITDNKFSIYRSTNNKNQYSKYCEKRDNGIKNNNQYSYTEHLSKWKNVSKPIYDNSFPKQNFMNVLNNVDYYCNNLQKNNMTVGQRIREIDKTKIT